MKKDKFQYVAVVEMIYGDKPIHFYYYGPYRFLWVAYIQARRKAIWHDNRTSGSEMGINWAVMILQEEDKNGYWYS